MTSSDQFAPFSKTPIGRYILLTNLGFSAAESEELAAALSCKVESHAGLVHLIVVRQAIERGSGGNVEFYVRLAEKVAHLSERDFERMLDFHAG